MMRMSLLDRAFYLLDSTRSPQDFTLVLHLNDLPNIDSLYEGARSAMNRFPASASFTDGKNWVWRENKCFKLEILSTASEHESEATLEKFIDKPFDLRRQPPVRQALILNGQSGARVATRFHHSAADGLSAALWLGHQLNVAYGLETAQLQRAPFTELDLRRLSTRVRRSKFAFDSASDTLWTSHSRPSGSRRWLTISFPAPNLQKSCRRAGGFTYNDLLATCALETAYCWNNCRGGTPWPPLPGPTGAATECRPYNKSRIGVWVPMNVRREHSAGFGNGTSRIRIYAKYDADTPLIEKCREVRRQVSWSTKHGEWVVPEIPSLARLPNAVARPLLRRYLQLPSVDMATAVFSHAGSWIANASEAFRHVKRIECIGVLHARQNLAINAATHGGQTFLTFTYDSALLSADEIEEMGRIYQRQIALARAELS